MVLTRIWWSWPQLLLLLWKSLLACIGGNKDIDRVKEFVREVESLPPDDKTKQGVPRKTIGRHLAPLVLPPAEPLLLPPPLCPSPAGPVTKAAPVDFQTFRNEISSKYPSYQPPPIAFAPDLDRLSAAAAPSPVRPAFSYHINPNHDSSGPAPGAPPLGSQAPVPGTPAPSPPPSPAPKPKKLQFQTDQSRPFVLPFAPANAGPRGRPRAVPASIEEAGELYRRNMRISTELWQTWKLREEYMAEESGLLKAARLGEDGLEAAVRGKGKGKGVAAAVGKDDVARLGHRMEELAIGDEEDEDEDPMDPLWMLRKLGQQARQDEEAAEDHKDRDRLHQRRVDLQRLERVEQLFVSWAGPSSAGLFPPPMVLTWPESWLLLHSAARCPNCKVA